MISRRRFVQGASVAGLGLLAGCGRLWGHAGAVPSVHRLGYLTARTAEAESHLVEAFREGLRDLGYIEGQNLLIEYRRATSNDELPRLADELARVPVDLILVSATPEALAARDATSTVPIVLAASADPVQAGLAATLAHPGGNVTGLSNLATPTAAKRLQLLNDAAPTVSRVGVLWNPGNPGTTLSWDEAQRAAPSVGVELVSLEVRHASDFAAAFTTAIREHADALFVFGDPLSTSRMADVVQFATTAQMPLMAQNRRYVDLGGLMSYGSDAVPQWRRAAYYVDRILKGTPPGDLPIEQATTVEFVINLKTAKALGLIIPQHVLLQATEVIQ
jgi:putative ABC transport system substrate-binding protein